MTKTTVNEKSSFAGTTTAKRLNNKAQARAAQPGIDYPTFAFTPKALHNIRCNPFGVNVRFVCRNPGWRRFAADPGHCYVTPVM